MIIQEVLNTQHKREFLRVPLLIYNNDSNYVRPLDTVIEGYFDPTNNSYFNQGEAIRWILLNKRGKTIGRIAAFINFSKIENQEIPTGGVGFFECVNDIEASKILFDTAKEWLSKHSVVAMEGPISFGENDQFWGLLVDGFSQPSYGMNYNPKYYQNLFEDYGFKVYYEQNTRELNLDNPFPERFFKIANWVMNKEGISFKTLNLDELSKFADDFVYIYNKAWTNHENFVPMKRDAALTTFDRLKSIIIPELVVFGYVHNEPASFIVSIPDLNQVFKYLNGNLNWYSKFKFFVLQKMKVSNRLRVVAMGVIPKFQKFGLESGLIKASYDSLKSYPEFRKIELSWVGDFNEKMEAIHKALGAVSTMKHITYKYMFNPNQKFIAPNKLKYS